MGTRNITRVICNGEVKINQYCQWDGYPTGRGEEVMQFMRDIITQDTLERFKSAVQKSTLVHNVEDMGVYYTGAPYLPSVFEKLEKTTDKMDFSPLSKKINHALGVKKITLGEANFMMVASRDSGPSVLPYMMKNSPSGMIFYTTDYLDSITEELDWQIEGMYVINLDDSTIKIIYHGRSKEFSFEELSKMNDEDIDAHMKALEDAE